MANWDEFKIEVQREMLAIREKWNDDNPSRTDYYYDYWTKNPEIPWSLLASLVSRNAGYQMSDLARHVAKLQLAKLVLKSGGAAVEPGVALVSAFWAFLEVGNFLIYRDVAPALEAWSQAKQRPEHGNKIFELLLEPRFGADPFIVDHWKVMFARRASLSEADIQRHTFALIINEQNQIEDRLVKGAVAYIGGFAPVVDRISFYWGAMGLARLSFPLAASVDDPKPNKLLLYDVLEFGSLDKRIQTGRDLFVGIFGAAATRDRVEAWVKANPDHHGTRADYNDEYYSTDPLAVFNDLPIGTDETYSPPLEAWDGWKGGVWYTPLPRKTERWGHLYRDPVPLPNGVQSRGQAQVDKWLSPLAAPASSLVEADLDDLEEIVDEDWQFP